MPRCSRPASPAARSSTSSPTPNSRRWSSTKIGPVKAQVQRQGQLTDLDPPNGYKISGRGRRRRGRFRQGRGDGEAHAERTAARCLTYNGRGADRRQAGAARPAPGQRRGQEDRRRILPNFAAAVEQGPRLCTAASRALRGRSNSLDRGRGAVQTYSSSKAKPVEIDAIFAPAAAEVAASTAENKAFKRKWEECACQPCP